MTLLPSQTERDAINLNTWEQAILYSANLLLAGENQNRTRFNRTFTINFDPATQKITINCLLGLDYAKYYASNLNLYKGIANFEGETNNRTATYDGLSLNAEIPKTIVNPPAEVAN